MKIVYCIPSTYNSGGMERILSLKTSYLADKLGHDVTVVTTEQNGRPSFFPFSKKVKFIDLAINYRQYSSNKFKEIVSYPILQYKHKRKLKKLLADLKPEVTVSMFQEEAGFLPKIKDGSKKLIESHFSKNYRHQFHNKGLKKILNDYKAFKDDYLIRRYDKFITLTHEDKEDWKYKDNIEVIPNPVTLSSLDTIKYREPVSDFKNILVVGRFHFQKGFDKLIEIWKRIEPKYPEWTLTIIGNQDNKGYVKYIKDLIERYNLKNIILKEPSEDISKEYDNSTFLALTSNYEGMPLTLIEGMSRGLPLISFACKCGPRDIIKDSFNGFLIPPGNINLFAKKMELLIKNPELLNSMSENALNESKKYNVEKIMTQWNDTFKDI
ncbi:MAG: glycosyltransferase family 4 protein [Muribaculaceae bacterium]|nr:glycosyltransferase family 4 protein [Muribaculaceae bacterium]